MKYFIGHDKKFEFTEEQSDTKFQKKETFRIATLERLTKTC